MDGLIVDEEFDREVRQAMRDHRVEREEAILIVALRRGQVYGAGDLVSLRPLSPEDLRRIGLDHDPQQLIADSRARLAEKAARSSLESDDDRADASAEPPAVRRG